MYLFKSGTISAALWLVVTRMTLEVMKAKGIEGGRYAKALQHSLGSFKQCFTAKAVVVAVVVAFALPKLFKGCSMNWLP